MTSTTTAIFDAFRQDLDEHNDRRERLIKASRDITNISKKAIFLLHRVVLEDAPASEGLTPALRAAKRGNENLRQVQKIYANMKEELVGDRFWRYQRQVSPGLQEYIEALSFSHFLEYGTLITFDQVQQTLCDSEGAPYFPLTISDYMLGLSDLTGELMRYSISGLTKRGGRLQAMDTLGFVRNCKADFEGFTPYVRFLSKKQSVTAQSLQKIEDAVYAIVVRSSEYDLPPEMLDDIVSQTFSDSSGDRRSRRRNADSEDEFDDETA
ncbi:Translin [Desarmillaria tabescens]|uniref:Translin n=1 Tax=Armillaria tabescens TaxID=1929756 RepID=A0AA39NGM6_ARMTA|nr:Translin [Desarmillaria tabescens]KAK0465276.1 Translin [Desarmillaria tabescens]